MRMKDMTDEKVVQHWTNIFKMREQILAKLGDKAKIDHTCTGTMGEIDCPVCGGTIRYRYSHFNGHIHGHCSTEGCLLWME